ncbi:MAG TPA: hypothetical protein VFA48_10230 [Gammaproteobacteria bacterium]|nr:hypothetical protein [Gammaproteobacteria bacterium]
MTDEATTGADVLDFIDAHGLKRLDACWLLGITPWRFGETIVKREQMPLRNASMAILLRLFEQWPEHNPLPTYPKPRAVYDRVQKLDPGVSKRVFGMALGCHPSWASARLDQADYSSPVIDRLLWLLEQRLDAAATAEQGRQAIHEWLDTAISEWRGRDDHRLDFMDG